MSEEPVEECNADIADRTFHASDAEEDVEQSGWSYLIILKVIL